MNLLDERIDQYQSVGWTFGRSMMHHYPTVFHLGRRLNILWGYAVKKNTAAIPFVGSHLNQTRHVCAFFNNDEEEYRDLLPFIELMRRDPSATASGYNLSSLELERYVCQGP